MIRVSEIRDSIYDYFQSTQACFDDLSKRPEEYAAYYTSMHLIQDATDALMEHRKQDFSNNVYIAYVEFWGVMQAVIVQQDAIRELHEVLCGRAPETGKMYHWLEIREMRNQLAGHPAKTERDATGNRSRKAKYKADQIVTRSFMSRDDIRYTDLGYKQINEQAGRVVNIQAQFNLDSMLNRYAGAAEQVLLQALQCMKKRWPQQE